MRNQGPMILAQLPTINRKLCILEYKNLNITKNEKALQPFTILTVTTVILDEADFKRKNNLKDHFRLIKERSSCPGRHLNCNCKYLFTSFRYRRTKVIKWRKRQTYSRNWGSALSSTC